MPSLLRLTKDILNSQGLSPKKYLSQNFLVEQGIYQKIIKTAELESSDQVIEVGPGLGFLTVELTRQAGKVYAIEIDQALAQALQPLQAVSQNLYIVNQDILRIDLEKLPDFNPARPYKVVANIPYHLTAKLLKFFLTQAKKPCRLVLLVQKEVAERIVAGPGQHSLLSLAVQFYGLPKIISRVSAQCFYPRPKVDSALIKIDLPSTPPGLLEEEKFWQIVKAGFANKRKKLVSNLATALASDKSVLEKIFAQLEITPGARAQHLSLEQWLELVKKI